MENTKENSKIVRFLKSIGIYDQSDFDMDFDLLRKLPEDPSVLDMHIVKFTPWRYDLYDQFMEGIRNNVVYKYKLTLSCKNKPNVYDVLTFFEDWHQSIYRVPSSMKTRFGNDEIVFISSEKDQKFNETSVNSFKEIIEFVGYLTKISFEVEKEEKPLVSAKKMAKIEQKAEKTAQKDYEETKGDEESSYESSRPQENNEDFDSEVKEYEKALLKEMRANQERLIEERKQQRVFKRGDYVPISGIDKIHDLVGKDTNVDFTCQVFSIEIKKNRHNDGINAMIGVHDDSEAIFVKAIQSGKILSGDKINSIKVGMNIRVKGFPQYDRFNKENNVMAHFIDLLPPIEPRKDTHEKKRVELHLHTKFSTFDGLSTIEEYSAAAKAMGHTALAITDHGVVQSFPNAQHGQKNYGLKYLYGSELYVVDDKLECAFNEAAVPLNNATYVVLDFETTGLSRKYDQILEFGAVKYERGMQIDQVDFFVKPTIKISKKITNLTGITQAMADSGYTIKEAIRRMEDFCKGAILVTHNAKFDIGFMNQARINNGYEPIKNPVVDTLAISRYLFPESKRHTLGALAKNMDITSYNQDEAHRADFDAKVLGEIWISILAKLTSKNKGLLHSDLGKLEFSNTLMVHYRPSHMTVLAKDPIGLKELYKLISVSHTEYFSNVPRTPKSMLAKAKEHLVIGSGCQNGEIWDIARTKTDDELVEAMKFYDFIEIQPPECYYNLIGEQEMSEAEIERTILDIVHAAKKAGKLVCVTGDVHYCEPSDKLFRDVYIFGKGPKGVQHPLNPFSRAKLPPYENPNQHFRSTQEMFSCFPFLTDEEKEEFIVTNTNIIADMIEDFKPLKETLYKPNIPNAEENLRKIVFDTAKSLYGDPIPESIRDRLEQELVGICDNGYAVTYSIAREIIMEAHKHGYIVGSRGSVGSSLVATMSGITEINSLPPHYRCPKCKHYEEYQGKDITSGYDLPEKYCPVCGEKMIHDGQNIPFATFLGFHADKVPDIDLNFPNDYQAKAHEYTKVIFGEDHVFRAGTISTIQEKKAIGYVKGYFEYKNINPETISRAKINYMAMKCSEVKLTTGQHPGGIVVVPKEYDIYDFCPINYPSDEMDKAWKTTHFEFSSMHDTLLKLDLLGHDDPMVIKEMCELVGINYKDIPLNDQKVLSLFSTDAALERKRNYLGATNGALGLPEFGTRFVRGMLDDTHPKTFAELVILSGLSHGTDVWQGNAEKLIKDKICTLNEVVGCRDDIMTFLIGKGVQPLTAFSTMEMVRKGKGIKPEYEEELRAKGVPDYYIDSCKKIKYMFPKAHACAYVTNALRVAYFKVYYPLEFYAIYFSVRCDKFDIVSMAKGEEYIIQRIEELKIKKRNTENHSYVDPKDKYTDKDEEVMDTLGIALEMYERGYKIEQVDLYKSQATKFTVNKANNSIIPPFTTIDGLGSIAAESVVEARKERDFTSQQDLLSRTKLSKTHVFKLEEIGALGDLGESDQLSLFSF